MAVNEIIDRLYHIYRVRYLLSQKTHWNGDDYEYDGELLKEIDQLKKMLVGEHINLFK